MAPDTSPAERRSGRGPVGAYGLRVEGLSEAAQALLGPAPKSWPAIEIRSRTGKSDDPRPFLDDSRCRIPLPNGGEIVVERSPMSAEIALPTSPRDHELLHPYLAYASAIASRWLQRECIHSGGFLVDGGVWAFVGERGAGKSSLLGWLAGEGFDVVSDDMLVIEEDRVFAGPRFVDLRGEAAEVLGVGDSLGVVGARERWRVKLGQIPAELPLRGWIFLGWSPQIELERVSASRRLLSIKEQIAMFGTPTDPASLLRFASLPAWDLRRPRGWDSLAESTNRLLDALSA